MRNVPTLTVALLFGSVARGEAGPESDLDLAVATTKPLGVEARLTLVERLAEASGRPVDLVELGSVGEPLLGEILAAGVRLWGSDDAMAELVIRHLREQADFLPYRRRILESRRARWSGT
jgi:predicted nucleotidyltransferase